MTLWDRIRDYVLATVRTSVAALVGALATVGIVLDERASEALVIAAMALATAVYHAAASWVQRQWPRVAARWPSLGRWFGWAVRLLLGSDKQPFYPPK